MKERKLFRETILRSLLLLAGVDSRVAPVNLGFNLDFDVPQLPFKRHAPVAFGGHDVATILDCCAVFLRRRRDVVEPEFLDGANRGEVLVLVRWLDNVRGHLKLVGTRLIL